MKTRALFCNLSSAHIAGMIKGAKHSVCYAGPGIPMDPAKAMVDVAKQLGSEMITVCIDFDERVMRMGYGDIAAVKLLREAGIEVNHVPGLRSALFTVDEKGYIFTPTALYLEAEPANDIGFNALRLSPEQVTEAQARLSPVAKEIAVAMAETPEEKQRIVDLPLEVDTTQVSNVQIDQVKDNLEVAPPVQFDVARQVRVFEPYFQYVELSLSGAAIQRHRLTIPPSIQKLGGNSDLEGRLRTTLDLVEKNSKLSSKSLENQLNEIRNNLTPSLGKSHGRVVLKSAKTLLEKRIEEFRKILKTHKKTIQENLQQQLDESRKQVVEYYSPIAAKTPPDSLVGQLFKAKPSEDDVKEWLDSELDKCFPTSESLIREMNLEVRFKDVTFETLNREDFLTSIKKAYPRIDWDKAYNEYKAAGELNEKDA